MNIHIPQNVYNKIMYWVNKADIEVSGFGKVQVDGSDVTILDAYMLKQEGAAATTEIDEVSLAQLMYRTKDEPGVLRFWWHSHVNMDVFWSSTDLATIQKLGEQGWCVATVFNKKYEMRSSICMQADTPLGKQLVTHDKVNTIITLNQDDVDAWDKEFTDNLVTKPAFTYLGKQWDGKQWEEPRTPYVPTLVDEADDLLYYEQHGLIGYGVDAESAALRMNPKKYLNKIKNKSYKDLSDLVESLEALEKKGHFDVQQFNY